MQKDKWKVIRDILISNCKIIFPVLIVILGAVTVVIALNAKRAQSQVPEGQEGLPGSGAGDSQEAPDAVPRLSAAEVPLLPNTDENIYNLVNAYYNAIAAGEAETLERICRGISENAMLYYGELANYVDAYSGLEVYTKQGPVDGTVIVYVEYSMGIKDYGECPGYEALFVCTGDDGSLYIKDAGTFTEEEKAYIVTANEQVDVAELNNRVNVRYNELLEQNPEMSKYIGVLSVQLNTRVGEILASRVESAAQIAESGAQASESGTPEGTGQEQPAEPQTPRHASTTDTVNVRSSDSEQADKLGKAVKGTKLEVREVLLNGWTKVVYQGKDGYIKSEFLQFEESAANLAVIGTVTANTNANVRAAADAEAAKLGMVASGTALDLLAEENGWYKVNYNGQVGYVRADLVVRK